GRILGRMCVRVHGGVPIKPTSEHKHQTEIVEEFFYRFPGANRTASQRLERSLTLQRHLVTAWAWVQYGDRRAGRAKWGPTNDRYWWFLGPQGATNVPGNKMGPERQPRGPTQLPDPPPSSPDLPDSSGVTNDPTSGGRPRPGSRCRTARGSGPGRSTSCHALTR